MAIQGSGPGFWHTTTGCITAVAGLLTGTAALVGTLKQAGCLDQPATPVPTQTEASGQHLPPAAGVFRPMEKTDIVSLTGTHDPHDEYLTAVAQVLETASVDDVRDVKTRTGLLEVYIGSHSSIDGVPCAYYTTRFVPMDAPTVWTFRRACQTAEGWRFEIQPEFLKAMDQ